LSYSPIFGRIPLKNGVTR